MASLSIITTITSLPLHSPIRPTSFRLLYPPILNTSCTLPTPAFFAFNGYLSHRKRRGMEVVTRAGANTSSYVFAAVFPLSLLAITIFTSIRIADKLDKDFLEDVTINQAVKEAEEENDEDEDDAISLEEIVKEPVLPRTRNRPKREV